MKPSVYIETTIVSYLTARPSNDVVLLAREILTRSWWTRMRGDFDLYTSDAVIIEASAGDPTAAAARLKALADIPRLPSTDAAMLLAERLAASLALPARARLDAVHVAVAAVHGVTFLMTWNCTHLANGNLAAKIERCCQNAGFVAPRIFTPDLLMESP